MSPGAHTRGKLELEEDGKKGPGRRGKGGDMPRRSSLADDRAGGGGICGAAVAFTSCASSSETDFSPSSPGRSPSRTSTWKPLQIPITRRPEATNSFSLELSGRSYVRAELRGFRGRPERGEVVWAMTNPIWLKALEAS